MGFILKLDKTLPNFTFEILSFDEITNIIEFQFSGGDPTYTVIFRDQSGNALGDLDGFTYTTTGVKTETLDATFGVTTIIGTIIDVNNSELSDSIMVSFTTTTTGFQPIVTQIDSTNLKFGGFISNISGQFGQNSPSFNEVSLDQLVNIDDLIIETTINKLELLDYDDNFKYEVDVDFSVNIEYDGVLNSGEVVDILIPRIRLELPINTFRQTVSTFQPQSALTSWRLYNVDSIAYELNNIILSSANNSFTFNASGIIELNIVNNTASIVSNQIDSIVRNDENAIIRLNRNIITNNILSVITNTIHHDNTVNNNSTLFNIGQTTRTFTYSPSSGQLSDNFYIGNLIRVDDINQPRYLLNSGDVGLAEANVEPAFNIINGSFQFNDLGFEIVGGIPNYTISVYSSRFVLDPENTDPATGTFIAQFVYNSSGIKLEEDIILPERTKVLGLVAIDGNGEEVNLFIDIDQFATTTQSPTTTNAGAPTAPSNASAQLFSNDGGNSDDVILTWNDNSTNETGFRIYRSVNGGPYVEYDTRGANITTFQDLNLSSGSGYRYRVTAYNANGESAFTLSNLVTIS